MNCQRVMDLLPLYVEGDLAEGECLQVGGHLQACPACSGAADGLRASQAWLKGAPPAPFTEADRTQLRQEVMARIRAGAPRRRFPLRTLLAAAAVLLALLVPGLLHRRVLPPPAPLPPPVLAQAAPKASLPPAPPRHR